MGCRGGNGCLFPTFFHCGRCSTYSGKFSAFFKARAEIFGMLFSRVLQGALSGFPLWYLAVQFLVNHFFAAAQLGVGRPGLYCSFATLSSAPPLWVLGTPFLHPSPPALLLFTLPSQICELSNLYLCIIQIKLMFLAIKILTNTPTLDILLPI